MNHCIFFMIILVNLGKNKNLIIKIFSEGSEIIDILLEILRQTKNSKFNKIGKILCNIFFDEFYSIFFDNNLEELYIHNNSIFTEENTEGLDRYSKIYYINILNSLINFNITYENLLHEGEDKALSK